MVCRWGGCGHLEHLLMSITGLAGVDVAAAAPTGGVVEDDEEAVGGTTDALDDIEALPLDMARGAILAGRRGCSGHGPKGLYAFGLESWGRQQATRILAQIRHLLIQRSLLSLRRGLAPARDEVTADD